MFLFYNFLKMPLAGQLEVVERKKQFQFSQRISLFEFHHPLSHGRHSEEICRLQRALYRLASMMKKPWPFFFKIKIIWMTMHPNKNCILRCAWDFVGFDIMKLQQYPKRTATHFGLFFSFFSKMLQFPSGTSPLNIR